MSTPQFQLPYRNFEVFRIGELHALADALPFRQGREIPLARIARLADRLQVPTGSPVPRFGGVAGHNGMM